MRPSETDAEYWRQAQATVDTDAQGEQHLYLNQPATDLVRRIMQVAAPGEVVHLFYGATLP